MSHATSGGGPCADRVHTIGSDGDRLGSTPGQLGAMSPGAFDAVVSSPPYAEAIQNGKSGIDKIKGKDPRDPQSQGVRRLEELAEGYGTSPGQLGVMPLGTVDLLVSSPPYADGHSQQGHDYHPERMVGTRTGYLQKDTEGYGTTQSDTFWSAASSILAECVALLAPGGLAVFVLKPYVRQGTLVDFPGDWQRLCEYHGLTLVERIEASLLEYHGTQEGLFGEATEHTTEKKSFFRRLAEKRGAPHIDNEIVLILQAKLLTSSPQ